MYIVTVEQIFSIWLWYQQLDRTERDYINYSNMYLNKSYLYPIFSSIHRVIELGYFGNTFLTIFLLGNIWGRKVEIFRQATTSSKSIQHYALILGNFHKHHTPRQQSEEAPKSRNTWSFHGWTFPSPKSMIFQKIASLYCMNLPTIWRRVEWILLVILPSNILYMMLWSEKYHENRQALFVGERL